MFLIEMKFIFKLGCCLIMENVSFSTPPLRKIIFKIYTQETQENPKKNRNEIQNKTEQKNEKIWYIGHTDSENFRNF